MSTSLPAITAPRLPYHPAIEERFGIGITEWRALVDAVYPLAKETSSIIMALSYCKARRLDPFKKVVHIVPMWNGQLKRMVETVWPGIGELRTTAFRTGQFAGRDEAKYGETRNTQVGEAKIEFPEWCQVTLYRTLNGERVPFPGPRVYWMEAYATAGKDDLSPNSMWRRRPFGQIEKCAEAAALRAAFPEEVGNEYTAEEMQGRSLDGGAVEMQERIVSSGLKDRLLASPSNTAGFSAEHINRETGEVTQEKEDKPVQRGIPQEKAAEPEAREQKATDLAYDDGYAAFRAGFPITDIPAQYSGDADLAEAWTDGHKMAQAEKSE